MSRAQLFEEIYTALTDDATLLALLGPKTSTNARIMRTFPQTQQLLSGYEPQGGEGWLVIQEGAPAGGGAFTEQFDSAYEIIGIAFHVFATRYSLADDVADVLDTLYMWTVEQQRALQYGERIVLFVRRVQQLDQYLQDVKLHQKTLLYRFACILETVHA